MICFLGEQIDVSNYICAFITGIWLEFLLEDDNMGQQRILYVYVYVSGEVFLI